MPDHSGQRHKGLQTHCSDLLLQLLPKRTLPKDKSSNAEPSFSEKAHGINQDRMSFLGSQPAGGHDEKIIILAVQPAAYLALGFVVESREGGEIEPIEYDFYVL